MPALPKELRDAAERIRNEFIPELRELRDSYADEARRAIERKAKLATFRSDLQRFPVAWTDGTAKHPTLYDWVAAYLDAGAHLDELLSARADAAPGSRADAGALRASTLGLIGRFRAGLANELTANPKLPRDLDAKVFAYLDLLTDLRAKGSTEEALAPPPDPTPADPTPPA